MLFANGYRVQYIPRDPGCVVVGPVHIIQGLNNLGESRIAGVVQVHAPIAAAHTVVKIQPELSMLGMLREPGL